jgi:SAM-dependent methyltransferase
MGSVSRYVGIDLSAGSLRIAQRNLGTGIWAQGDACKLPFPDDSFDVVAFSSVLHHLPACELALREAHRVLKAGGAAFAFDPNLLNPVMATFRWPSSPLYIANGVSPNESPVLPGRLRSAFESAGFGPIQQRCQGDIPFRRVAKTALSRFLPLYNAGDRALERIGLGRWFGSFVITVGQKGPWPSREAA